jgi:hypothetical protein
MLLSAVAMVALAPVAADAAGPAAHHAPIGSKVVPFKSIGAIKLGMTSQAVLRKLGKPPYVRRLLNGEIYELGYDGSVFASFAMRDGRNQCYEVAGFGKRLYTPEGIHTGSSLASLKHAYRGRGLKERNAASYILFSGPSGRRRLTPDRVQRVPRQDRAVRHPAPVLPAVATQDHHPRAVLRAPTRGRRAREQQPRLRAPVGRRSRSVAS